MRKVQVMIYLRPDQIEALKILSQLTRVPRSVYIREGIALLLDRVGDGSGTGMNAVKAKEMEK